MYKKIMETLLSLQLSISLTLQAARLCRAVDCPWRGRATNCSFCSWSLRKEKITKNIAVSCIDEKHFWSETSLTVAPCTICSNVTCKNEYPELKSKGKTNGSDIRFHSNFGFTKSLGTVSLKLAGRSMLNDHTHQTQLVTGRVTTISCLRQSCPVINEGQINS